MTVQYIIFPQPNLIETTSYEFEEKKNTSYILYTNLHPPLLQVIPPPIHTYITPNLRLLPKPVPIVHTHTYSLCLPLNPYPTPPFSLH